jgi:hypothetical protein
MRSQFPEGVYLRRGTRLWIRYTVRGRKYREPAETNDPREAAQLRRRRIEQYERGERTRDSGTLRVAAVLAAVLRDYEINGRRSLDTARSRVAALAAARLGDGGPPLGERLAVELTTDHVEALQVRWQRAGLTNATINRRCNLLRRGFRLMVRAKKLHFVPYIPRLKEQKRRGRYIAPADLETLMRYLPAHLPDLVAFAYDDGIRKGQLARTLRRYVDLARGVIEWPPEECKRDEAHVLPLEPGGTLDIVERLLALGRTRLWCPYLFHGPRCAAGRRPSRYYGCVGDFKKAWATACARAGFPVGRKTGGFVFHHTRNSAVTNFVAAGLSESDAMKMTGHQTAHVFRHYDLGDVEALRARLAARRAYVADRPAHGTVRPLRARS